MPNNKQVDKQDSCDDPFDRLLPVADARARVAVRVEVRSMKLSLVDLQAMPLGRALSSGCGFAH